MPDFFYTANSTRQMVEWIQASALTLVALTVLMHLLLAMAVFFNAHHRQLRGQPKYILGRWMWAFVTVMTGVVGFALYWLVNDSRLTRVKKASDGAMTTGFPSDIKSL